MTEIHLSMAVRGIIAVLCIVSSFPCWADEGATAFSREEITFQLALTEKIRGDHAFLLGDSTKAKEFYSEATAELEKIDRSWHDEYRNTLDLLKTDILYRESLIAIGADFWGGTYGLTPINPVEAFMSFEATVKEFESLAKVLDEMQIELAKGEANKDTIEGLKDAAKTERDAQAVNTLSGEIQATFHTNKITVAENRIDTLIQRQKVIAEKRSQLSQQYAQIHKALDSLVVKSVLEASGLPPELSELGDSKKPFGEKILSIGRAAIDGKNPQMTKAFAGLSGSTARLVDSVREMQKLETDLNRIKATTEAIQNAVTRGTIDSAFEAGALIYEQLEKEDRSRLTEYVIKKAKPIVALMETARKIEEIGLEISQMVSSNSVMRGRLLEMLQERVRENSTGVDKWYRERLKEASMAVNGKEQALVVEQALKAWPSAFFEQLPEEVKEVVRNAVGKKDDATVIAEAFSHWPPSGMAVNIDDGKIVVQAKEFTHSVRLADFINDHSKHSIEMIANYPEMVAQRGSKVAKEALQEKFDGLLKSVLNSESVMAKRFAQKIDALDETTSLVRVIPNGLAARKRSNASSELFDQLWNSLKMEVREKAGRELAVAEAGSLIAVHAISQSDESISGPRLTGDTGGQKAVNEALLKTAITAAFPAAGVAFAVADAVKMMGDMSALANEMNQLAAEDRTIMKEQIVLFDLASGERHATALAELSIRLAQLRVTGAYNQINRYESATGKLDKLHDRVRIAQRFLMPRAFYLAERLRMQFDQLDRAIAFWIENPEAPRGQISKVVTNDPQWIRYAVDPGIQIFKWLDRSGESDRGDLRQLAEEWNRKLALARDVCTKVKCTPMTAVVGDISEGVKISLKTLLPSQWAEFEAWKLKGGKEFVFEFFLTPEILKPNNDSHLIRYVAARAGVVSGRNILSPEGDKLAHPGYAYVPIQGRYIKERYRPDAKIDLTWNPFSASLRTRWRKSLALDRMEGYGMYTLWRYSLRDNKVNKGAEDIIIQFAYQSRRKSDGMSDEVLLRQEKQKEEWSIKFTTEDKFNLSLPLSEMSFWQDENDAKGFVALLSEKRANSSNQIKLLSIEQFQGSK